MSPEMEKTRTQKILLVSGNDNRDGDFEKHLARCSSAQVLITGRPEEGLEILGIEKVEAVFIDCSFLHSGFPFMEHLRRRTLYIPVIAIIEPGKEITAAEALKEGAFDYVLRGDESGEALGSVFKRLNALSGFDRDKGDELEQQSLLFRQIYKSQKWWQSIIDAITDYLFVIDESHRILRTNKAFAGLFEKEPADIILKPYYSLYGLDRPHEWCSIPHVSEGTFPRSVERRLNGKDYLISCYPICHDDLEAAVYIMKDITETRRLKDQVYHLDKLSSLGTLTSGVAHEINNPLTGIIGYTEMLLMKEEGETTKKYLRNVYDSAIRCKRIVENMLIFSRQAPSQKSIEDINEIVDKTIELHKYSLKSTNIEIIRNYGDVPSLSLDHQQMQQVILNLLINAEHAIAETDRHGRIEFRTSFDPGLKRVLVEVSDNGRGIPPDVLPKIFDPFFTTKPVNKGTGLGLSIAHGIIAEQGGTIEVKSVPGKGTSFIIAIPRAG